MSLPENLHSTLVAWLKVVLPLIALGILSTLFLVARTVDPEDAIPFAEVDIADRVREPRLTTATWAGITDDGTALTVTADEARPAADGVTGASAQALRATFEMPDGGRAELTAAEGRIDTEGRALTLSGDVVITTARGYRVTTAAMTARLDRTALAADSAVSATGPLGTLTAGSMAMAETAEGAGQYVLVFKSGVRLLYDPKSTSASDRSPVPNPSPVP